MKLNSNQGEYLANAGSPVLWWKLNQIKHALVNQWILILDLSDGMAHTYSSAIYYVIYYQKGIRPSMDYSVVGLYVSST